ncbi:UNVERIFIED_CONTAM: Histone-lysine N-methyltransferase SETMAR [Trichonephila clavipes]
MAQEPILAMLRQTFERTTRRWYAKFQFGDESLANEDRGRLEAVVDNEVRRVIVEQNPGNTFRDYAEELGFYSPHKY